MTKYLLILILLTGCCHCREPQWDYDDLDRQLRAYEEYGVPIILRPVEELTQ